MARLEDSIMTNTTNLSRRRLLASVPAGDMLRWVQEEIARGTFLRGHPAAQAALSEPALLRRHCGGGAAVE